MKAYNKYSSFLYTKSPIKIVDTVSLEHYNSHLNKNIPY